MFSRNASSLLQGTECKSEAKFSGGALKRVSRFMWLLNSATDEKFEIKRSQRNELSCYKSFTFYNYSSNLHKFHKNFIIPVWLSKNLCLKCLVNIFIFISHFIKMFKWYGNLLSGIRYASTMSLWTLFIGWALESPACSVKISPQWHLTEN